MFCYYCSLFWGSRTQLPSQCAHSDKRQDGMVHMVSEEMLRLEFTENFFTIRAGVSATEEKLLDCNHL